MKYSDYFLNQLKKIFKVSKWVKADKYIWLGVTRLGEAGKSQLTMIDYLVYNLAEKYDLNVEVNDPLVKQLDGATYLRSAWVLSNKWDNPDSPFAEVSIAVVATTDDYTSATTITVNLDFIEKNND